ncbi:MAG: NAD-dependent epimerase, partial [Vicinamibacteria bacterium]
YNVAGPGEVPLSVAIREAGGTPIPVPEVLLVPAIYALFKLGLWNLPPGAALFAKYPCTVDGSSFVADTGFETLFTLEETLRSIAP